MGCCSSTPLTSGATTAASHRDARTQDAPAQEQLVVGPDYKPIKHLGKGGTGDTWAFLHVPSGEQVAVKFIRRPLPRVLLENITREFTIQADLGGGHVSVIRAREAVLTPSHLCLVMEYAAGGSLTAYVADRWRHAQAAGLFLSEDEARFFFRQFLGAVSYCHAHAVAHRDLKLDNTLLDGSDPPVVKICDFGFARTWGGAGGDANMYTQIGTPVYMSPELISTRAGERGYDGRSVDVWASGILLLVMLLGSFPFDHTDHPDPNTSEAHLEVWLQQVSKRWSEVPHMAEAVKGLTPECKDLLNRIFTVDAKKRITVEEITRHPWYRAPLPPALAAAAAALEARQAALAARRAARRRDEARVAARAAELRALVQEACRLPAPGESRSFRTIDLSEDAVVEGAGADGGGHPLVHEEAADGGAAAPAAAPRHVDAAPAAAGGG